MNDFVKICRIGTLPGFSSRGAPVAMKTFVNIQYKDGKLSITGVEGPLSNGDAFGGCGQIDTHLREPGGLDGYVPAPGWSLESVNRLLEIWDQWHLNDMSPCDSEMIAAGWREKALTPMIGYRFTAKTETHEAQRKLKEGAISALTNGDGVQWDEVQRALIAMPYELIVWKYADEPAPDCPDGYKAGDYKGEKTKEHKTLGWIYPKDHPDGLLTRKLRADGPGYGSQWFKHDVPDDVLAWLQALPDADITPAWA